MTKVERHQQELFPRVGFFVTNLRSSDARVAKFYNGCGTAEQWTKEAKSAVKWTRLSWHDFVDNQVQLRVLASTYNLGNFLPGRATTPANAQPYTGALTQRPS